MFTETVSPRKFLVISIYGRKMLSELNVRVLETRLRLCCDGSCRDRGPRNSSMFKESQLKVISKVLKEQNTNAGYLFLFS